MRFILGVQKVHGRYSGGAQKVHRRYMEGAQKVYGRCNANDLIGCGGGP